MGGRLVSQKGGDASERIRSYILYVPIWNMDIRVADVCRDAADLPAQKEIDRPPEKVNGLFLYYFTQPPPLKRLLHWSRVTARLLFYLYDHIAILYVYLIGPLLLSALGTFTIVTLSPICITRTYVYQKPPALLKRAGGSSPRGDQLAEGLRYCRAGSLSVLPSRTMSQMMAAPTSACPSPAIWFRPFMSRPSTCRMPRVVIVPIVISMPALYT